MGFYYFITQHHYLLLLIYINIFLCYIIFFLFIFVLHFMIKVSMTGEDTYKYNSVVFARYIAAEANSRRITINMTKIQKLLYISYGVYLAVRGERLLNEHPQAWPYGPVFPTTRNKLLKQDLYSISLKDEDLYELRDNKDAKSLINIVFSAFGNMSAMELSEWSHSSGSPWDETTQKNGFKWGRVIEDGLISDYFKKIIKHKNA